MMEYRRGASHRPLGRNSDCKEPRQKLRLGYGQVALFVALPNVGGPHVSYLLSEGWKIQVAQQLRLRLRLHRRALRGCVHLGYATRNSVGRGDVLGDSIYVLIIVVEDPALPSPFQSSGYITLVDIQFAGNLCWC